MKRLGIITEEEFNVRKEDEILRCRKLDENREKALMTKLMEKYGVVEPKL